MTDPNGDDGLVHHYKTDAFTKVMLSIVSGSLVAGVVGIWSMSTHVAALDERMAQWSVSVQGQINQVGGRDLLLEEHQRQNEQNIFRNGARLDALERGK